MCGVAFEHLFQGSALNAVDAKGRVSVPASLRSVIEKRSKKGTTQGAYTVNFNGFFTGLVTGQ